MNSLEIIKIYGKNYLENTKKLLNIARLEDDILKKCELLFVKHSDSSCLGLPKEQVIQSYKKSIRIGIKPNLVSPTPAEFGATTHVEVVEGIIEYLKEKGFSNITIMEGSWVGDKTEVAFDVCGYDSLANRKGVKIVDAQKDGSHDVNISSKEDEDLTLTICNCVDEVDFMINVPVLKGHCQTKITCALKNMKGLIPNTEKRHFHTMGLHKPIGYLAQAIHQDFIVVDHICGDLDFEDGGNPVVCDCIMAAKDPVLVDAYVCKLLNYKTSDVPYVEIAAELGCGEVDITKANIYKLNSENILEKVDCIKENYKDRTKLLQVNDLVEEVYSCSACYGALIPVLDRLKEEGYMEKLKKLPKICIGQGYRNKSGRIGVGNCTNGFDNCVKGCPPTEEDIYDELLKLILND